MCSSAPKAPPPPPPPAPEAMKILTTPEDEAGAGASNARKATGAKRALRIDLGAGTPTSGLNIPIK